MFVPTYKLICDAEPGTVADHYVSAQSHLLSCDNTNSTAADVCVDTLNGDASFFENSIDDDAPYIREFMLERIVALQNDIRSYDFRMSDRILLVSELPLSVLSNGEVTHDVVSLTATGATHVNDFLCHHHKVTDYAELVAVENGNYNGFDISKSPVAPSDLLASYVLIPNNASEEEYRSIEYHVLRAVTLMSWNIERGNESAREIIDTLNVLVPALSKTVGMKQETSEILADKFLLRRRFSSAFNSLNRVTTLQERMSQALSIKRFNAALDEYKRWADELIEAETLISRDNS